MGYPDSIALRDLNLTVQSNEVIRKLNRYTRGESNLPSGNIFGVFAVAGAIGITDLEHGSDGASVFAGDSLQADIVLAAVFRVGVTAEGASVRHLTRSGATETVRYFWETPEGVTLAKGEEGETETQRATQV